MAITQLVYVSSYVDEFGIRLPDLIERSALGDNAALVKGMTLFAHGDVLQLLEGESSAVSSVFTSLPMEALQFGVLKMLEDPVKQACLAHTCIGLASNSLHLQQPGDRKVEVFKLCPAEVDRRIADGTAKKILMRFAQRHT
jgi:hypothetical protein